MKKYIVLISGVNAQVEAEGYVQRCSFQTTRLFEAEDPHHARHLARDTVDRELDGVIHNKSGDPLVISVDWMKEVESFEEYSDLPYRDEFVWFRE